MVRVLLTAVGFAAVGLIVFLVRQPIEKETYATIAAALAVIAAVIAAWPSIRVLELQEDAGRPSPIPYFDVTSRYGLLLLRVKNFGAAAAYDVRLRWDAKRPPDDEGSELTALDEISVLVPQDSISAYLGPGHIYFQKNDTARFTGTVEFRDATGRRFTERFIISADDQRRRLKHDDEMLGALHEIQKLPSQLQRIQKAIERLQDKNVPPAEE